jgi:predicted RNA-binding protein with EMAP domain
MTKKELEQEIVRVKSEIVMSNYNGWDSKKKFMNKLQELESKLNALNR